MIGPFLFDDDEDTDVHRKPKVARFESKVVTRPLFFSVTWTSVTSVNGNPFTESVEFDGLPDQATHLDWVRNELISYRMTLTSMGVDVRSEYIKHGGDPNVYDVLARWP